MTCETLSIRKVKRSDSGGRGEPLLALFDELTSEIGSAMAAAYHSEMAWVDGVRAAMWELLTRLDASPPLARFLIVGSRAGSRGVVARRGRVLDALCCALESDSPSTSAGCVPPPFGASAVVDAVASVLHARLAQEPAPALRELCGALMGVVVLPYLGADAARQELLRPPYACAAGPAGVL